MNNQSYNNIKFVLTLCWNIDLHDIKHTKDNKMCYLIAKNDNKMRLNIPPNHRNARSHWAKRKKSKEEGQVALVTIFYLANERKNLNFNLIKEYLFYVKIEKNDDGIVEDLDLLGDHTIIAKFKICIF